MPADSRGSRRRGLTNTAIDALQPGQEIKDDRVPGLSVRATRSGKSFLYYYRVRFGPTAGTQRRPKIGAWGLITISQARDAARVVAARVAFGEDPGQDKATARSEPTVDDLWARCKAEHWTGEKAWDKEAERIYTKHLKRRIGKMKVRALSYDVLKKIHVDLADTPTAANHAIAVVSKMLSLAACFGPGGKKWSEANPCDHIARYPIRKRKRFPRPEDIAAIGPILKRYSTDPRHLTGAAFIYLMLYSGARPSEILNASPDQVERVERNGVVRGVLRVWGKTSNETGEMREVYLPPQAMAVLDTLPTGRKSLAGRSSLPNYLWDLIRKEAGCPDLWLRDWRRGFSTVALSAGIPKDQVGELLGHASTQTTSIYAKLFDEKKHEVAAATADKMDELLESKK